MSTLLTSSRAAEPTTTNLKSLMRVKDSDAKCLNGATPDLYYRPAQASNPGKYIVWFNGGGYELPTAPHALLFY